jgi:hypothetical protein
MATKARLSCPVRCAAISLGPNLPRQPIPPEQKNNRTHLRGKNTELLMAKQLTKIHPRQFSRFGIQFSPIREHKRCFRAISRAIRDNWRYFETSRENAEQPFVLRSWCGAKRVILQNEPNFGKMKNELNPLSKKELRRKMFPPPNPKTNPIEPNFQLVLGSWLRLAPILSGLRPLLSGLKNEILLTNY